MTSTKFIKHFASEAGLSQNKAREILSSLDDAIKSYLKTMESGDSVKVVDTTYKIVTVPARSGVAPINGGVAWTSPEHDTVKAYVSKSVKDAVSE